MRRSIILPILAATLVAAGGLAACSRDAAQSSEPMTADLERDLALATAPRPSNAIVSEIEGGPSGAPSGTERGQRNQVAVRKRAPTPRPAAETQEVAAPVEEADLPAPLSQATMTQTAPAPAPITEPEHAPTAEPAPEISTASGPSAGGNGEMDTGRSGSGRRGGGLGGIIGVIIRGGAVMGDDRCEPRARNGGAVGRGGRNGGIGVAIGGIGGIIRIGQDGDARSPVGRPTYPRY